MTAIFYDLSNDNNLLVNTGIYVGTFQTFEMYLGYYKNKNIIKIFESVFLDMSFQYQLYAFHFEKSTDDHDRT